MPDSSKMIVAGVGGQGVVFLTNLLVEASMVAGIPVATSEIHGLAQRSGSVVAGLTFGAGTFGFVEKGGADFLIGLEPLEAQRCLPYLNASSKAVIDSKRILPYAVNAGQAAYPDVAAFIDYLRRNIADVIFNAEYSTELAPIVRNVFVLGRASKLEGFPVTAGAIEEALRTVAKPGFENESLHAFQLGRKGGFDHQTVKLEDVRTDAD